LVGGEGGIVGNHDISALFEAPKQLYDWRCVILLRYQPRLVALDQVRRWFAIRVEGCKYFEHGHVYDSFCRARAWIITAMNIMLGVPCRFACVPRVQNLVALSLSHASMLWYWCHASRVGLVNPRDLVDGCPDMGHFGHATMSIER